MITFYTKRKLKRQPYNLSEEESKLLGIVKFTNVNVVNRLALRENIEELKNSKRGALLEVKLLEDNGSENGTPKVAPIDSFMFWDRPVVTLHSIYLINKLV